MKKEDIKKIKMRRNVFVGKGGGGKRREGVEWGMNGSDKKWRKRRQLTVVE